MEYIEGLPQPVAFVVAPELISIFVFDADANIQVLTAEHSRLLTYSHSLRSGILPAAP